MKSAKLILFLSVSVLLLASCTKENTPSNVQQKVSAKTWEVTYYWDKDKDETYKFSGYTFNFNADQTMDAISSGSTVSGTWAFDNSDDSYDHFIIAITAPEPLDDLVDDWHVVNLSDDLIELKDESGSGGIEYLTFRKKS